jgi:hypothetical protein
MSIDTTFGALLEAHLAPVRFATTRNQRKPEPPCKPGSPYVATPDRTAWPRAVIPGAWRAA